MNEVDKKDLRRLAECASSGPWLAEMEGGRMNVANEDWYLLEMHHDQPLFMTDAAFIAAANPSAILSLLDDLDENEGVIAVWRGRLQRAEAELEKYRKDALRYRAAIRTGLFIEVDKEEVDAHIDAAMVKDHAK